LICIICYFVKSIIYYLTEKFHCPTWEKRYRISFISSKVWVTKTKGNYSSNKVSIDIIWQINNLYKCTINIYEFTVNF